MQVTIVNIHHCAKFGANPLNGLQNFPSKPQNTPKYGCFQTFKNSPKIEKNLTDPISGVQVTSVHMYHCAKFGANPLNDVQNFHRKLKIVHGHTDRQTYDGRHVMAIATWSDGPRWLKILAFFWKKLTFSPKT